MEYKDHLSAPLWAPLGGPHAALGPSLTIELSVGTESRRFLRIRIE